MAHSMPSSSGGRSRKCHACCDKGSYPTSTWCIAGTNGMGSCSPYINSKKGLHLFLFLPPLFTNKTSPGWLCRNLHVALVRKDKSLCRIPIGGTVGEWIEARICFVPMLGILEHKNELCTQMGEATVGAHYFMVGTTTSMCHSNHQCIT